ncbi:unnamed protein product [Calypogeia fissa]
MLMDGRAQPHHTYCPWFCATVTLLKNVRDRKGVTEKDRKVQLRVRDQASNGDCQRLTCGRIALWRDVDKTRKPSAMVQVCRWVLMRELYHDSIRELQVDKA